MSILRKASLPTLVSIAAIAGVFFVAQPRVIAATPERVIKAIQDIKNYTINSFTIEGNERHLQSKTSVNGKDRNTVYYDSAGKETKGGPTGSIIMGDSPMKMGFTFDATGNLKDMSKADIEKIKGTIRVSTGSNSAVTISGANGKGLKNQQEIKIQAGKDANGKPTKRFFVNGKEVDKLPEGIDAKVNLNISKDGIEGHQGGGMVMLNAEGMKGDKSSVSKSMAVVGSGKNGEKPMIMQSGQTSADYLVNLLQDTSRWTIERGVDFNGQRLDKFTLKGPVSVIVLYVDPATALPKVLRFGTPMQEGVTIEDVYEYNIQPSR